MIARLIPLITLFLMISGAPGAFASVEGCRNLLEIDFSSVYPTASSNEKISGLKRLFSENENRMSFVDLLELREITRNLQFNGRSASNNSDGFFFYTEQGDFLEKLKKTIQGRESEWEVAADHPSAGILSLLKKTYAMEKASDRLAEYRSFYFSPAGVGEKNLKALKALVENLNLPKSEAKLLAPNVGVFLFERKKADLVQEIESDFKYLFKGKP